MYLYCHTKLNGGFDPICVASGNISEQIKSADLQLNLGKITLSLAFVKYSRKCHDVVDSMGSFVVKLWFQNI